MSKSTLAGAAACALLLLIQASPRLLAQDPPEPVDEEATFEPPDPWLLPVEEMPPEPEEEELLFAVPQPPLLEESLDSVDQTLFPDDPCPLYACNPSTLLPDVQRRVCSGYTASVAPLRRCPGGSKFLCTGASTTPLRLVGASADAACHLSFNSAGNQTLFCNQANGNWKKVIDNLSCRGLNKMRLWVTLNGNPEGPPNTSNPATSFPFAYDAAKGHWRLDQENVGYFNRLVDVVSRAQARGIYVEITFFAPWEGEWEGANKEIPTGPFAGNKGKWCLDNPPHAQGDLSCTPANLVDAGFADQKDFVVMTEGRSATGLNTQLKRAREAQRNLIQWTVNRLWCFENVFFEIANEPEGADVLGVTPLEVAKWQAEMIEALRAVEKPGVAPTASLAKNHLISVQPFTTEGASYAFGPSYPADAGELQYVDLINGHYTTVRQTSYPVLNTGALKLAREFTRAKPIGFNETKISGLYGVDAAGVPLSLKTGTEPCGQSASARAEAWEFLLNLGAVYDHWGYDYASTNGQQARRELCYLKNFLQQLPVSSLKAHAATGGTPPTWVNVGTYPAPPESLASGTDFTYWAALEPNSSSASNKQYVLYLHRDRRACVPSATCGCQSTSLTTFRGYHPAPGLTPTTTLTLKNLFPGNYDLYWLRPETARPIAGTTSTLEFFADQTCRLNGLVMKTCKVTAPQFAYDLALWLRSAGGSTAQ